jgi:copper chaperone CopZ
MKRFKHLTPFVVLALCLAAYAWAGGATCPHDGSSAATSGSQCTGKAAASSQAAAPHCTGKDASASAGVCPYKGSMASGQTCTVKANQVMYSFAVPTAECEHCVDAIQKAAMDTKGISCAHVDLNTHTAYIIADKNVSRQQVSKMITTAGFKNKYEGQGQKVEAQFAKAMAAGNASMGCCAKGKDKV